MEDSNTKHLALSRNPARLVLATPPIRRDVAVAGGGDGMKLTPLHPGMFIVYSPRRRWWCRMFSGKGRLILITKWLMAWRCEKCGQQWETPRKTTYPWRWAPA